MLQTLKTDKRSINTVSDVFGCERGDWDVDCESDKNSERQQRRRY